MKARIQGDVPVVYLATLPKGGRVSANRIVAVGESTGHDHRMVGDMTCYEYSDRWCFVIGPEGAELIHASGGEHAPIPFAPGQIVMIPRGVQQREYDGEQERRVLD